MDWAQIEGKWDVIKGQAKQKWGKLTDDDLTTIKGKRDILFGHVKQTYGIAKEEVEKQIEEFRATLKGDDVVPSKTTTTTTVVSKEKK